MKRKRTVQDQEYAAYIDRAEIQAGISEPPPKIIEREKIVEVEVVRYESNHTGSRDQNPVDRTNPTNWGKGWWER